MEQPYEGRAVIQDDFTRLRIIIPTKKNWFVIIFIVVWVVGWFIGFASVFGHMFSVSQFPNLFMLFWLASWSVAGLFAFRKLYWMIAGKEIITLEPGRLTLEKKAALFIRPKYFATGEVKNMRIQDDDNSATWPRYKRGDFNMTDGSMLRFDYGFKTIKFAIGIDEAEANYILALLLSKKIFTAA